MMIKMKWNDRQAASLKEIVLYLVVGGCTTAVSFVIYFVCTRLFSLGYYFSDVLSWVGAVTFSFFANKRIVFKDEGKTLRKALLFYASRLATLGLEMVLMYIGIELLMANDLVVKIAVQMVVIVSNYLAGKLVVFRKK